MQSLIEKGYELVSGGTDNHLVLVNLKNKVKGDTSVDHYNYYTSHPVGELFLLSSGVCIYVVLGADEYKCKDSLTNHKNLPNLFSNL